MSTTQTLDETRVEEFVGELVGHFTSGLLTFLIDIGNRTELFDAAAEGPATSEELAARAGLTERYVREWLAALVTAGIFRYDADTATYTLPAEHAACLTSGGTAAIAGMAQLTTYLAKYVAPVTEAFRHGGGVPYSAFQPEFTSVMDAASREAYDGFLLDAWVPLVPGLVERFAGGVRVADLGCGTGHALVLLATAFPQSTFVGFDIAEPAIAVARAEATAEGLTNVAFEVADVASLKVDEPFDVVTTFDAIHDQADPAAVLARVYDALVAGGTYLMKEPAVSSNLEENIGNPMAPFVYAVSTLHCMTVSLAEGGAGLGTGWGRQLATTMLGEAGFTGVTAYDVPGDPMDAIYVSSKPL